MTRVYYRAVYRRSTGGQGSVRTQLRSPDASGQTLRDRQELDWIRSSPLAPSSSYGARGNPRPESRGSFGSHSLLLWPLRSGLVLSNTDVLAYWAGVRTLYHKFGFGRSATPRLYLESSKGYGKASTCRHTELIYKASHDDNLLLP